MFAAGTGGGSRRAPVALDDGAETTFSEHVGVGAAGARPSANAIGQRLGGVEIAVRWASIPSIRRANQVNCGCRNRSASSTNASMCRVASATSPCSSSAVMRNLRASNSSSGSPLREAAPNISSEAARRDDRSDGPARQSHHALSAYASAAESPARRATATASSANDRRCPDRRSVSATDKRARSTIST